MKVAASQGVGAAPDYRGVFECLPALAVILDADDKVLDASEAFLAALGRSRPQVVGRAYFDLLDLVSERICPFDPVELRASLERVRASGQGDFMSIRPAAPAMIPDLPLLPRHCPLPGPDGRPRHLLHLLEVVRGYDGVDFSGGSREAQMATDLSHRSRELKAATRDLAASEEAFRLLVDQVKDYAIFMLDPHGNVVSWNQGAQRIKGFRASEIIGRHFSTFYTPQDLEAGKPAMELRVASATGRYEEEGWRVRRDGSRFMANVVITALRDRNGRLRGFAKVTRDITERKAAEEQLQRHREDLERQVEVRTAELRAANQQLAAWAEELARSNEDLERFAYVASHDLQEPLRAVSSSVQVIARRYQGRLGEDADEFIGYAVDGARTMSGLIQDLLAYSRLASEARDPEPTPLAGLVERALQRLRASVEESRARITVGKLPTLPIDPVQGVQLFQNLIGNAIKFRSERPLEIRIDARPAQPEGPDRVWEIAVEDNGIGIEPRFRDRVFAIFQRLHPRSEYPGAGMGLSICRRIVERHGGRIWVEGEPGQGSAFRFTLPEARPQPVHSEPVRRNA